MIRNLSLLATAAAIPDSNIVYSKHEIISSALRFMNTYIKLKAAVYESIMACSFLL